MIAYIVSGLTSSPHFLLPIIREKKKSSLQVRNVPHQKKSGNRRVKALQKPRGGSTRFSETVKSFLKDTFNAGTQTGRKADPGQVSADIRKVRNADETRKFSSNEWLTKAQVQSFFSRLSSLNRKANRTLQRDHAIVYLLHLALEALDQDNCWIRFFFADFKKAFDMIDHKILMSKVASFNLHPCLVQWIAVFLEGRTQSKPPFLHLSA